MRATLYMTGEFNNGDYSRADRSHMESFANNF